MKDLKWMRDDNKSKFYPYCVECGKNNDRKREAECSECSEEKRRIYCLVCGEPTPIKDIGLVFGSHTCFNCAENIGEPLRDRGWQGM